MKIDPHTYSESFIAEDPFKSHARARGVELGTNDVSPGTGAYLRHLALTDIENITGSNLNDTILGNIQNNILIGNAGNDRIFGGTGDDILTGGDGSDVLKGGEGDDSYLYELGNGVDIIDDTAGLNRILFAGGVRFEEGICDFVSL